MKTKVLVVRFSAMGDVILTTGPLAQLRQSRPGLSVDLLTSEVGQEIYINSIDVDRTFVLEKGSGLFAMTKLYSKMPKYDIVIDLQGNFKSHFLKLFQRKADFFHIEKHSKERREFVKNRKNKDLLTQHVTQKYYATIQKAIPDLPDKELEELRPLCPPKSLTFDKATFDFTKSVVIHPFASQKNKEWPHFSKLVKSLLDSKTPVILVGHSHQEIEWPKSPLLMNLINKTTLREMGVVMKTGKALVTTDSGPMHMGVAVHTPTIALFGPTTREFGFDPRFKNCWIIEEELECRPCHVHGGDVCPLLHHDCMEKISVERVLQTLRPLL